MLSLEDERQLHLEAMDWLSARTNDGVESISRDMLKQFHFEGERLTLIDTGRGIRKPAICRGALTIMTAYTPSSRQRRYEDVLGNDGLPRYKMRADARGRAENAAVVAAMEFQLPLIWLVGVAPGWFQPVFPVYVLKQEAELDQFVLAYDASQRPAVPGSPGEQVVRRYLVRETRQRLHQPVFRAMVLRAYGSSCTICNLRHGELLDAAHIVPDSEEKGIASVTNGMAMCKIHHAAYDTNLLGITPYGEVRIATDLLTEVDGPMLRYGLQQMDRRRLTLPQRRADRPDRDLLAWRYEVFRSAAGAGAALRRRTEDTRRARRGVE